MNTIKVRMDVELDKEFIGDVLVTAFDGAYGGCWYWAHPAGRFMVESEDHIWTDVHIKPDEPTGISDVDSIDMFTVNAAVIRKGIQMILDRNTKDSVGTAVTNMVQDGVVNADAGAIDALGADCIVQVGLFGRVVFA